MGIRALCEIVAMRVSSPSYILESTKQEENIQSPPKERKHFFRAEYSKVRGARWKEHPEKRHRNSGPMGTLWHTPFFSPIPPGF